MIRHVVLFTWREDFSSADRADWAARVRALEDQVPGIRSLTVGDDVMASERSYDTAIVADFDTIEDVQAYAVHPDHLPLIGISGPGAQVIASVDFEL